MATDSRPSGLIYLSDFIPPLFSNEINEFLEKLELTPVPGLNNVIGKNPRMVKHYGYVYDYTTGNTLEKTDEYPKLISDLRDTIYHVLDDDDEENLFDQCIINKYLPGQGINAHIDKLTYGDKVASFTFNSGVEMEFQYQKTKSFKLYVKPDSLYIMTDESRFDWTHQIRPRKSDVVNGQVKPRKTRFSITFRSVKHD